MALGTYSELKDEIVDHLDDDSLSAKVDTFIDIAEARHKREIRIREMIRRSQASATGRFLALPDGFVQMVTLRLLTDPITVMSEVNLDEMNRRRQESTGTPEFYTVHEEIELDRVPDEAKTAEMIYYATFAALSNDNTTNGLLTRAPDVYLYGALAAAAPWLVDDERVPLWETLYSNARDTLVGADRRSRYGGPIVSRVSGGTP